ncbi:MAG: transglycosylase SLT domain-containing protein [Fusobacteriales bacterium]|jgi:soluble lytic murein transglycosylase-like protein|nr:transglycosylase SLT domain-containing protein [Fusobacteriales bacterium]
MKNKIVRFFLIILILSIYNSFSAEKEIIQYMKSHNPKLSNEEAQHIYKNVVYYSNEYDFDPVMVLSVMKTESHFKHSTVSTAGAKGLLQLMPFNFKEFKVNNTIEGNIKGGVMHLKRDYEKTGDIVKTLVCYNAGCGRLKNSRWLKIKETTDYITKINSIYPEIQSLYYGNTKSTGKKITINTEDKDEAEYTKKPVKILTKQEKFQKNKIAFKRNIPEAEGGENEKN